MRRLFFLFSLAALPLPAMGNDFFAMPKSLKQSNGEVILYENMNSCQKELTKQWVKTAIVYEEVKKLRAENSNAGAPKIDQETINQMMLNQQLYDHQLDMLILKGLQ